MMRTPTARVWYSTSSPASESPLRNTPTMSAPRSVPQTVPRPPKRLVPPMTTAVMESRLRSAPAFGLAALLRPIAIHAPTARIAPAARYTLISTRLTLMPARRAASLSSPTAYTCRPQAVLPRMNATTTYSTSMSTTPKLIFTPARSNVRPVHERAAGMSTPRMVAPLE